MDSWVGIAVTVGLLLSASYGATTAIRTLLSRRGDSLRRPLAWTLGLATLVALVVGVSIDSIFVILAMVVLFRAWMTVLVSYPEPELPVLSRSRPPPPPTEEEEHRQIQQRIADAEAHRRSLERQIEDFDGPP